MAVDARNRMDVLAVDRTPSAEEELAHFEAREAEAARAGGPAGTQRRRLPLLVPRYLVGLGEQWDGEYSWSFGRVPSRPGPHCLGCHGRRLGLSEVCGRCDRSGIDDRQPAEVGRKREAEAAPTARPEAGRLVEMLAEAGIRRHRPQGGTIGG